MVGQFPVPGGSHGYGSEETEGTVCQTGSAIQRLPPELVDAIIGLLHTDPATLATCALVCKSWVPASRYHRFSQLVIRPRPKIEISELLSSTMCTIAPAVQHLKLVMLEGLSSLHDIASSLPNVMQLTILKSTLQDTHNFSPAALVSLLENLHHLQLINVRFDTPDLLFSLLRHSPQLRSVIFSRVRFKKPNGDSDRDQYALTPELKSLKVQNDLLPWVMECWAGAVMHLTTVDLDLVPRSADERSAEKLMMTVGASLHVLRLSALPDHLRKCPQTKVTLACPWYPRF
jgi:hypothetical protein